jgi:hypothetical protein
MSVGEPAPMPKRVSRSRAAVHASCALYLRAYSWMRSPHPGLNQTPNNCDRGEPGCGESRTADSMRGIGKPTGSNASTGAHAYTASRKTASGNRALSHGLITRVPGIRHSTKIPPNWRSFCYLLEFVNPLAKWSGSGRSWTSAMFDDRPLTDRSEVPIAPNPVKASTEVRRDADI